MGCSSDSRESVLWCDEPQRYCRRSKSIIFLNLGDKCPLAVEMVAWGGSRWSPARGKYGCVGSNKNYPKTQWRGQYSSFKQSTETGRMYFLFVVTRRGPYHTKKCSIGEWSGVGGDTGDNSLPRLARNRNRRGTSQWLRIANLRLVRKFGKECWNILWLTFGIILFTTLTGHISISILLELVYIRD